MEKHNQEKTNNAWDWSSGEDRGSGHRRIHIDMGLCGLRATIHLHVPVSLNMHVTELQRDVHLLWRRHTAQLTCDEMWSSCTRPSLIVTRWMPMRDRDCMCSTLPAINSEAFRRGALCLQPQHKQLSSTVTFRNVINQTVQQQMSYENKRAIKLSHNTAGKKICEECSQMYSKCNS